MTELDQIVLIILYSIFSLSIGFRLFTKINIDKKITIKSFFELYYLLVYGMVPIVSIIYINQNSYINYYFFTNNTSYYYYLFVISVIFYLLFLAYCYLLKYTKKMEKPNVKIIDVSSSKFFVSTIIISLIGIISIVMWTKVYGMPWDIIKYANIIRSGKSTIYNKYTFLKPFCSLVIIAFYNNIVMFGKTKFKLINVLNLIVNLFFSIIFLLANDSRMFILIFFLTIFLYFKNQIVKLNIKTTMLYILLAISVILVLGRLDNITYYIRHGQSMKENESNRIVDIVHNEFTYTYRNGINVLYFYDMNMLPSIHEMKDLENIALSWVPERFKQNKEGLTKLNTSYYYGISGVIPTDIITASIYKFHVFGIIIMPLIISFILKLIESFFTKYSSKFMDMIYNLVGCNVCLRFIAYYDLSDNLFTSFYIIVSLIIICILCYEKKKKNIII